MNKKFLVSLALMFVSAVLVVIIGIALNFWEIGFKWGSALGLVIIIPAVVWVLFKGVNYINSALYFGGIAFVIYKNVFDKITFRYVLVFVFLVILAVVFAYFGSLFEDNSEENSIINEKGQDESDG